MKNENTGKIKCPGKKQINKHTDDPYQINLDGTLDIIFKIQYYFNGVRTKENGNH